MPKVMNYKRKLVITVYKSKLLNVVQKQISNEAKMIRARDLVQMGQG